MANKSYSPPVRAPRKYKAPVRAIRTGTKTYTETNNYVSALSSDDVYEMRPGKAIEAYIEQTDSSIDELSKKAGISEDTLLKLISGNEEFTSSIIKSLAKATKTTPEMWRKIIKDYETALTQVSE